MEEDEWLEEEAELEPQESVDLSEDSDELFDEGYGEDAQYNED